MRVKFYWLFSLCFTGLFCLFVVNPGKAVQLSTFLEWRCGLINRRPPNPGRLTASAPVWLYSASGQFHTYTMHHTGCREENGVICFLMTSFASGRQDWNHSVHRDKVWCGSFSPQKRFCVVSNSNRWSQKALCQSLANKRMSKSRQKCSSPTSIINSLLFIFWNCWILAIADIKFCTVTPWSLLMFLVWDFLIIRAVFCVWLPNKTIFLGGGGYIIICCGVNTQLFDQQWWIHMPSWLHTQIARVWQGVFTNLATVLVDVDKI